MLRSRGTFHRSLVAALSSLMFMLTACTGTGEDSPDDDGAPTMPSGSTPSGSTPSESTSAQAEPIDVDAADNLDPCTLVPRDTWLTFIPQGKRDTARAEQQLTDLPLGSKTSFGGFTDDGYPQYACVVSYGDREPAVAWGWYLGAFTPQMVNRMYADLGGTTHDRGSYAAVTGRNTLTSNAVGLGNNDLGFFVVVDAPIASLTSDDLSRIDRQNLKVLDLLSLHLDTQPRVLLPAGCPGPRDPAVTAVLGRVEFARGSNDGEGRQFCLYRNPERGQVLRLRGGTDPQEVLADILEDSAADGRDQDLFDGSSGAVGRAVTTTTGTAVGTLIDDVSRRYAFAYVDREFLEDDAPPISRAALITLLESFYASEPGATTVGADRR